MAEPAPNHKYGFYSPGEYLYELQGQLLRAVRIRVDVGLHTGRMTFDRDRVRERCNRYEVGRVGGPGASGVRRSHGHVTRIAAIRRHDL